MFPLSCTQRKFLKDAVFPTYFTYLCNIQLKIWPIKWTDIINRKDGEKLFTVERIFISRLQSGVVNTRKITMTPTVDWRLLKPSWRGMKDHKFWWLERLQGNVVFGRRHRAQTICYFYTRWLLLYEMYNKEMRNELTICFLYKCLRIL